MKTPVQVNWLDYWFSAKVDKVSFANYVGLVRKLTADGQTIFAVEVGKGFYKVQYGGKAKDLGKKATLGVAAGIGVALLAMQFAGLSQIGI